MSAKQKRSVRTSDEDVPELDRNWIEGADYYEGAKLVRRGRPKLEKPRKISVISGVKSMVSSA